MTTKCSIENVQPAATAASLLLADHSDFSLIKLVATTDVIPDERIEDILKKYPQKRWI